MKIGWRIWLLLSALVLSLITIININSSKKLMVFLLLISAILTLRIVKSKAGKILISSILILIAIFLVANSFESGVLVKSISQDSQIFQAGLRQGDIIKSINGKNTNTLVDYSQAMNEVFSPGGEVRLQISTTKNEYVLLTNETPIITVSEIKKQTLKQVWI